MATLNVSNPPGSSSPKIGDDYIRTLAEAVATLLGIDHYMGTPVAGDYTDANVGKHSKVTFQETQDDQTLDNQTIAVSSGDTFTSGELVYANASGDVVQISRSGSVNLDVSLIGNDKAIVGQKADDSAVDTIKVNTDDHLDVGVDIGVVLGTLFANLNGGVKKVVNIAAGSDGNATSGDAVHVGQWLVDQVAGGATDTSSVEWDFPFGLKIKIGALAAGSGGLNANQSITVNDATISFVTSFGGTNYVLIPIPRGNNDFNRRVKCFIKTKATGSCVVGVSATSDGYTEAVAAIDYIAVGY